MKYSNLHVKQHDEKDCGAAALSMILRYFGAFIPLYKLREDVRVDAEGASIYGVVKAAEHYGLIGDALEGDIEELADAAQKEEITAPFMARIITPEGYEHFVTIFEVTHNNLIMGDPGRDVHKITWEEFGYLYAGQIISFHVSNYFQKIPRSHHIPPRYRFLIKRYQVSLGRTFALSVFLALISLATALIFGYVVGDIATLNMNSDIEVVDHVEENEHQHEHSHDDNHEENKLEKIMEGIVLPIEPMFSNLWVAVPVIIIFYFVQCILSLFRNWLLLRMAKGINQDILADYYRALVRLPKSFTDSFKAGEILQRMEDTDNIRDALSGAILTFFLNSLYLILGGGILYYISVPLFGVAVTLSFCYVITILYFRRPLRNANYEIMEADSNVMNHIKQTVDGAGTIKSFRLEARWTEKADNLFDKYTQKAFKAGFLGNAQEVIITAIDSGGTIVLLTIGAWLMMHGRVNIGDIMSFYFVYGYFSTPVKSLTNLQPVLQSAIIAAERLDDVFETTKEKNGDDKDVIASPMLKIENLSFRYAHREKTLDDISFVVPAKQHIAIIGESGSGKSTLGKLLIRLYDIEEGSIEIDGRPIETFDLAELRCQVVYVSQDSYVFRDSLRNNLILGMEGISDEEIMSVCRECCLEKTISRLSGGLDTMMDENGANLSTGERERVNIARALLVKPKILIVDEVTSNLDYNIERTIIKLLESLKDTTCVQITHRLSTIKKCDKIIVLKDGKIIESGSFDELYLKKGEMYSFFTSETLH